MKVHLGCGKRYLSGFVHVDLIDAPHIDYQHDVRTLPMFSDGSVELIYACHVLEYFDRSEALEVLQEWRRVLSEGGVLRLAVPDFAALVEVYRETSNLSLIHGPLFGAMKIPGPDGPHALYHRTVYDFDALSGILRATGFRDVHRYDWRETIHKDFDDFSQAYIPHMDKEAGRLIGLNVDALK